MLGEYRDQRQALSRFFVGAILLTEPVLSVVRRELRRLSPDVRIDLDEIADVITNDVLKRDVVEGDKAVEAKRKINRMASKRLKIDSRPRLCLS